VLYHTTRGGKALQWLAPEQTAGGQKPYLFTQGQAVFTRTWIPLQDSPGVRIGYDATISVPDGFTAVMSAERTEPRTPSAPRAGAKRAPGAREFHFEMRQPIPSYLIALAVGDLAFEAISNRTGVWAEPSSSTARRRSSPTPRRWSPAAEKLFGPIAGAATTCSSCRPRSRTAAWRIRA
jgi:aminopeptidase N